jgi:hypothetical protein
LTVAASGVVWLLKREVVVVEAVGMVVADNEEEDASNGCRVGGGGGCGCALSGRMNSVSPITTEVPPPTDPRPRVLFRKPLLLLFLLLLLSLLLKAVDFVVPIAASAAASAVAAAIAVASATIVVVDVVVAESFFLVSALASAGRAFTLVKSVNCRSKDWS